MKRRVFEVKRKIVRSQSEKNILLFQLILGIILVSIFSRKFSDSCGIGIINDEFGYWGIAASWSGKDWSDLLSSTPYYSFGYSILLVPIFMLNVSPEVMYQIAKWGNVLLVLGSYVLAYWCGKKIFSSISKYLLVVLCFVITLYSNNIVQAQVAWTETLLYCLYWVVLALLIRVIYYQNIVDVCLFAIFNAYIYYVHQRAIGIILSSILIFALLVICKKISIKQFIFFGAILTFFIMGGMRIKSTTIDTLFTNKDLVSMNNYSGQSQKVVSIFSSISGLWYLIKSILGKMYYIGASTFLVAFVALVVLCKEVIDGCCELVKNRLRQVENIKLVFAFILMSFSATFLISAISMYLPYGRLDLLLYGRYVEFAIGPMLLVGLIYILEDRVSIRFMLIANCILIAISALVDHVLVSLDTNDYNGICITALDYFFQNMSQVQGVSYWIAISFSMVILVFFFIQKEKMRSIKNVLLLTSLAIIWIRLADYEEATKLQQSVHYNISAIAKELEQLSDEYDIYMIKDEKSSERYAKYLQYFLYNDTIHVCEYPDIELINNNGKTIFIACNDGGILQKVSSDNLHIIEKNDWLTVFWYDGRNF